MNIWPEVIFSVLFTSRYLSKFLSVYKFKQVNTIAYFLILVEKKRGKQLDIKSASIFEINIMQRSLFHLLVRYKSSYIIDTLRDTDLFDSI